MSEGTHTSRYHEDTETYHTSNYDNDGWRSFDWNPETGDITGDHYRTVETPDDKANYPDSNIWDDLDKDDRMADEENNRSDDDDD